MEKLKKIFSTMSWFSSGVLGGDKYQKYLAFHRQSGCSEVPLTEREFWQDYYRYQEENPGARCC
ncbi:YbdD/YjiX family protein [uncultured Rothia sp.]|uniref:YbdD/YjiX family protein n=1 Tax=uncultured Rothia sp. TaxID=316088 RepID=UPI0032166BEB